MLCALDTFDKLGTTPKVEVVRELLRRIDLMSEEQDDPTDKSDDSELFAEILLAAYFRFAFRRDDRIRTYSASPDISPFLRTGSIQEAKRERAGNEHGAKHN